MPSTYAQEMHRQAGELVLSYQSRLDELASEGRSATPDEAAEMDRWEADIERLNAETGRIARMEALRAASDALRGEAAPRVEEAREQRREPTDREVLREVISGARGAADFGPAPEARSGERTLGSRMRDIESRALGSAGGSAIPTSFYDQLMVYERTEVPMLAVGNLIEAPDGHPVTFPRLTADPATNGTAMRSDGGTAMEVDPTLDAITLGSFSYPAITVWAWSLDQDNVIGLEEVLGRTLARELRISNIGAHLTTGTGTTQPWGIVTRAANGGTATGTAGNTTLDTFFGPADMTDLQFALAKPYRDRGAYLVATTAFKRIRKFRDSDKAWLFQPSLSLGAPDTFDGKPIYENPAMAAVASATKSVVFGDLSEYFVKRVTPVRIQRSEHAYFKTDQVGLKVVERVDGDLRDTAAVAYMVSANT